MNTLKKALATAAAAAVPALAAAPAQAEVLFDNTNTVGENPGTTAVAFYDVTHHTSYASLILFTLPNPTEPHGGLRLTFDAAATGPGAVQISMMQIGSLGVETRCDEEGIVCADQTVYTLVPGTESATKTVNFTAGTGDYSIDFDGYAVSGGDYAILVAGAQQDNTHLLSLRRAAPESMVGIATGIFFSTPDLNTFRQATGGVYAPNSVGLGFKIETLPAVPEPDDYAMFLAGLGLVGLAARRRMDVKHSGAVPVRPSMDA